MYMKKSTKKTSKPKKSLSIEVLYEDAHIVAVNKPAGLVVHSDGKTVEPFLTDWILKKYPGAAKVGEPIVTVPATTKDGITKPSQTIVRPGIVHRLDRETSGVMLIAKTKAAHASLKAQFQEHTIKKKYNAFLYGEIKEEWGIIERPIGRSTGDFRKWSATRGARGELRPAVTWWNLIKAGYDLDTTGKYSFVEAEPKTGRTHQIRVHFKAINHPVVCDKLYAAEKIPHEGPLSKPLGFKRTALHASSITFTTIGTKTKPGKPVTVKAPFPADFKKAMKEMGIVMK
jgi:23S rRNA pseudouridine1911/1915/1917 synthase